MARSVKFSDDAFIEDALAESKRHGRSLSGQIVYWAKIGLVVEKSGNFDYTKISRLLAGERGPVARRPNQTVMSISAMSAVEREELAVLIEAELRRL
ncbi:MULTISPECIES: TA system antitoxin ParD family protein [unclassified Yoonia]|uniref:TA system antitoxin ParD family protein n=1 Tax=unclassified Yoonia TaxID=2629118 RepID=UPI002AFE469B|nr:MULTISPECIES: hypothetical protein [unclassified Yoonia]